MTDDIFSRLRAPFPADRVSWRVGATTQDKSKGMALAYIDARDVMERLDDVCGPAGWQCRYPHATGKTVCEIGLRVDGEWLWKADGAGDTDHEAEKGALSDAFKRAAVRWGVGRYLYDVSSPWVVIEGHGKSYRIKDSEFSKLHKLLDGYAPAAAAPAIPDASKARYIAECKRRIQSHVNGKDALGKWWKDQSQALRDYGLTQTEVDELKTMVIDRGTLLDSKTDLRAAG